MNPLYVAVGLNAAGDLLIMAFNTDRAAALTIAQEQAAKEGARSIEVIDVMNRPAFFSAAVVWLAEQGYVGTEISDRVVKLYAEIVQGLSRIGAEKFPQLAPRPSRFQPLFPSLGVTVLPEFPPQPSEGGSSEK